MLLGKIFSASADTVGEAGQFVGRAWNQFVY